MALTAAIGLRVVEAMIAPVARPTPATLIGSGKVDEIKAIVAALEPEVVIVNAALSPVQQRNLERAWNAKVLDRTALILEIFGERARTREGRLQVELAHLTYQRSRLVRSLDASGAPARRLRLSRRPRRNPDRNRPPPDRRAHRQDQEANWRR